MMEEERKTKKGKEKRREAVRVMGGGERMEDLEKVNLENGGVSRR